MKLIRFGPWIMGLVALLGMALLPVASAAHICRDMGCLPFWLFWLVGIAVVCAVTAFRLFYLAASHPAADVRRTPGRALALALPAAFCLVPMIWLVCLLATQLYGSYAIKVSMANLAWDAMIAAGAALVAVLGMWGVAAARHGGLPFAVFIGGGLLASAWPLWVIFVV